MQISLQKQKLLFFEIVIKTGGVFIIYFLKVLWKFAISSGWFLSQKKKTVFVANKRGEGVVQSEVVINLPRLVSCVPFRQNNFERSV